jgi:hypothetical protein
MDHKPEGRPSFKTSDVVKKEVRDVIENFITALCSTLFKNVVFSDEDGFIFKV